MKFICKNMPIALRHYTQKLFDAPMYVYGESQNFIHTANI